MEVGRWYIAHPWILLFPRREQDLNEILGERIGVERRSGGGDQKEKKERSRARGEGEAKIGPGSSYTHLTLGKLLNLCESHCIICHVGDMLEPTS